MTATIVILSVVCLIQYFYGLKQADKNDKQKIEYEEKIQFVIKEKNKLYTEFQSLKRSQHGNWAKYVKTNLSDQKISNLIIELKQEQKKRIKNKAK